MRFCQVVSFLKLQHWKQKNKCFGQLFDISNLCRREKFARRNGDHRQNTVVSVEQYQSKTAFRLAVNDFVRNPSFPQLRRQPASHTSTTTFLSCLAVSPRTGSFFIDAGIDEVQMTVRRFGQSDEEPPEQRRQVQGYSVACDDPSWVMEVQGRTGRCCFEGVFRFLEGSFQLGNEVLDDLPSLNALFHFFVKWISHRPWSAHTATGLGDGDESQVGYFIGIRGQKGQRDRERGHDRVGARLPGQPTRGRSRREKYPRRKNDKGERIQKPGRNC